MRERAVGLEHGDTGVSGVSNVDLAIVGNEHTFRLAQAVRRRGTDNVHDSALGGQAHDAVVAAIDDVQVAGAIEEEIGRVLKAARSQTWSLDLPVEFVALRSWLTPFVPVERIFLWCGASW